MKLIVCPFLPRFLHQNQPKDLSIKSAIVLYGSSSFPIEFGELSSTSGGSISRHITLKVFDMTEKTYLTLEPEEKSIIHEAKERDERFASPTRISDGAYVALLAQERMEGDDE